MHGFQGLGVAETSVLLESIAGSSSDILDTRVQSPTDGFAKRPQSLLGVWLAGGVGEFSE